MRNTLSSLYLLIGLLFFSPVHGQLLDPQATPETVALFRNLMTIQQSGKTLFGHQDAILYGRTWTAEEDRSDVKDITGSHPAVIGLDFANVTRPDEKGKAQLIKAVKDTWQRGGVLTFAWHMSNPANDGSFYWDQNPVKVLPDLLPGGKYHDKYNSYLKAVADVNAQFLTPEGKPIPLIFRPFHEYDGDWFWWGKGHATRDEFVEVWKYTIHYLRDELNVHNFIYAFSPDCKFTTEEEFMEYYPGNEYVDMIGFDDYWDFRSDGANNPALTDMKMAIVTRIAQKNGKLAAFTETGLEGVTNPDWFTQVLLPVVKKANICYVLVWRNDRRNPVHHYTPDKGHPAEEDFRQFCADPTILMENELPRMYQ